MGEERKKCKWKETIKKGNFWSVETSVRGTNADKDACLGHGLNLLREAVCRIELDHLDRCIAAEHLKNFILVDDAPIRPLALKSDRLQGNRTTVLYGK
jgi:hypothetical protein